MASGQKAIIAAAGANLGIALSKFAAWALTGSSAMLAEAIHSCADTGNQALLLYGGRRARQAPDAGHQFGYGSARYLYAFIVSIVLFTLGGCFALYEAYHKFVDPHPITAWHWVPVAVLINAIGLEVFSLRTALHEAAAARGQMRLWEYIRTSRSPEIPVVLLEDIAALLGLVFALFGVGMTLATGDGRWDALGSAMIGILLVVIAAFLARETSSLLLGESLTPALFEQVRTALAATLTAGGCGPDPILGLRTLHLGPEEVLVAAKFAVPATASASQIAQLIDSSEAAIRACTEMTLRIYLEPDLGATTAAG